MKTEGRPSEPVCNEGSILNSLIICLDNGVHFIVYNAIEQLGSYQGFLVSVILAGILQLVMGYLKAGTVSAFFPSSVIKGMLAAIGLILIIKQIPHAVGYDISFEGDESYMQESASSSFDELLSAFRIFSPGATLISIIALGILFIWELPVMKRFLLIRLFPGALVAVAWGIIFNTAALKWFPEWSVSEKHLVSLPSTENFGQFLDLIVHPDFSFLTSHQVYVVAATLAIIASLESLLCLEAVDKLDPYKRTAPPNRELKAQGVGNIISGMLGGLPMTTVIVRSSANINAGGHTRIASFFHGILLFISVLYLTDLLNLIPLACLAAILLHTGFKLAHPKLFAAIYRQGWMQFLPFIVTITAILLTDLLQGIFIGIIVGLYFVIRAHYHSAFTLDQQDDHHYLITFNKDVSFLNKPLLRNLLMQINENSKVVIDTHKAQFMDHDIAETLTDFITAAPDDNITVLVKGDLLSQFINQPNN